MEKQETQDITEYIKLSKLRTGYTWEIKVVGHNVDLLKTLNDKLIEDYEYGGDDES